MWPAQNSHSSVRLASLHSHQPVRPPSSKFEAASGPSSLMRSSNRIRLGPPLIGEEPQAPPACHSPIRACHPPAKERVERERQKRGLMRPILEQPAPPLGPQAARLRRDWS